MQLCFIRIMFIPSERTMFNYNSKLRTSSSRLSNQIDEVLDQSQSISQINNNIHKIIFWTDSKITMSYIRNSSKRFLVYIMNPLREIKLNSNINEWCFIPGKNNSADPSTCYNSLTTLTPNFLWIKGPHFLYKNESVSFES